MKEIKFCTKQEAHKLYSAMQVVCPCFRDKDTPFTQKEVDILCKALLSASQDQARAFVKQVAYSSKEVYKHLMLELGKNKDVYLHLMGDE